MEKILFEKTKLVMLGTKKDICKVVKIKMFKSGLNVRPWDLFHPVSREVVGNEGFKISASMRMPDRL